MNNSLKWSLLSLSFSFLVACGGDDDDDSPAPEPQTIVDVAVAAGNFTVLVNALETTGLDEVLDDANSTFTVFAPTDEAFAALGEDITTDPDRLSDILSYHVVIGSEIMSSAAVAAAESSDPFVEMANGDNIGLSYNDPVLNVNLASVSTADRMADNGVIHVIDKVLLPPESRDMPTMNIVQTAIAAGNFTSAVDALQAASLDAVLADETRRFTVFAPTDDAFAKIDATVLNGLYNDIPALTNLLLQHVIADNEVNSIQAMSLNGTSVNTEANNDVTIEIVDGDLFIQGSKITTFDVYATNGVIHVIDTVITETLD